jgi:hypothetical protein
MQHIGRTSPPAHYIRRSNVKQTHLFHAVYQGRRGLLVAYDFLADLSEPICNHLHILQVGTQADFNVREYCRYVAKWASGPSRCRALESREIRHGHVRHLEI